MLRKGKLHRRMKSKKFRTLNFHLCSEIFEYLKLKDKVQYLMMSKKFFKFTKSTFFQVLIFIFRSKFNKQQFNIKATNNHHTLYTLNTVANKIIDSDLDFSFTVLTEIIIKKFLFKYKHEELTQAIIQYFESLNKLIPIYITENNFFILKQYPLKNKNIVYFIDFDSIFRNNEEQNFQFLKQIYSVHKVPSEKFLNMFILNDIKLNFYTNLIATYFKYYSITSDSFNSLLKYCHLNNNCIQHFKIENEYINIALEIIKLNTISIEKLTIYDCFIVKRQAKKRKVKELLKLIDSSQLKNLKEIETSDLIVKLFIKYGCTQMLTKITKVIFFEINEPQETMSIFNNDNYCSNNKDIFMRDGLELVLTQFKTNIYLLNDLIKLTSLANITKLKINCKLFCINDLLKGINKHLQSIVELQIYNSCRSESDYSKFEIMNLLCVFTKRNILNLDFKEVIKILNLIILNLNKSNIKEYKQIELKIICNLSSCLNRFIIEDQEFNKANILNLVTSLNIRIKHKKHKIDFSVFKNLKEIFFPEIKNQDPLMLLRNINTITSIYVNYFHNFDFTFFIKLHRIKLNYDNSFFLYFVNNIDTFYNLHYLEILSIVQFKAIDFSKIVNVLSPKNEKHNLIYLGVKIHLESLNNDHDNLIEESLKEIAGLRIIFGPRIYYNNYRHFTAGTRSLNSYL